MAWIESHQSLWRHPKAQKAARLTGVSLHEMIGLLHCLWWWSLDYAEDGDLSCYEREDIETAIGWTGAPGALYDALTVANFIDTGDQLHDWQEYAGRLLEKRADARERAQASRERSAQRARSVRAANDESARSVHPYNHHQPTNQPEPTNQNQPPPPPARADKRAGEAEKPVVVGGVPDFLADLWRILLDDMGVVVQGKREELKQHNLVTVAAWNQWFQEYNAKNKKRQLGAGAVINRIHDGTPLPGAEWIEIGKEWVAEKLQELVSDDTAALAVVWNNLFPQDRYFTEHET